MQQYVKHAKKKKIVTPEMQVLILEKLDKILY